MARRREKRARRRFFGLLDTRALGLFVHNWRPESANDLLDYTKVQRLWSLGANEPHPQLLTGFTVTLCSAVYR